METGWEIKRYSDDCKEEWDGFVRESRNGTFLFMRGYMDYHADRFADFSLMASEGTDGCMLCYPHTVRRRSFAVIVD